ncbi:response regulator [Thermospira aquatica]|uniref:histidine kinase n=1 Tax=Thermospira aquatica TaxID=2828656 RepID=A0AAX3BEM1_9SPIR|nr:response regulator [Thermospira aquatica]URA10757.1 response regulator [Thermospira aquatica]
MVYKIAIVEDEAIVAHSIEQKLLKLGYEVSGVFHKAEDLFVFLEQKSVDLILMDILLQNGISGIEAAEQILHRYHIPVIYLTAFSDDATLQKAARTEPYGYLIKPFNDRELKATVEMALYKAGATKELVYREARWKAVFVHMREGMVVTDNRGQIISVNPAMESLVNLPAAAMENKSLDELFIFSPTGTGERTFYLQVKSENIRIPVHWISSLISDDLGQTLGSVHIFHDIRDQFAYENALIESEERYRRLVEYQTDWIVRLDESGSIRYANHAMADALGWEKEQIINQNFFDIVPSMDRENWRKLFDSLTEPSEVKSVLLDYEKNGRRYVIEWCFRCVHPTNRTKTCKEYQGVGRDITLLRETEEALREEDEFLKRILTTIDEAVVITDEKGRIEFTNPRGREIVGTIEEKKTYLIDILSFTTQFGEEVKDFEKLCHKASSLPAAVWVITNQYNRRYEVMLDISSLRREDKGKTEWLFLMTDLTLFNKLQQEFYRIQRFEAMEVLAGGIAHDFNNILTVIMGNISLLRLQLGENNNTLTGYLQEAEEACERAKKLTSQMLSFSHGGSPMLKQENILKMLEDTVRFMLQGSSITWKINQLTENVTIPVDITQLGQVIQNLVLNAREAMDNSGEIVISLEKIEASHIQQRIPEPLPNITHYLRITIQDTGPGIDPEILPRIFDPYVSTKSRGSGLGLAIVYTIIRRHHGLIEVASEPGKGTTFFIYLPLYQVEEEPSSKETDQLNTFPSGNGKRIWILDDEVGIVKVLEKTLRQQNYEVKSFQKASDFLARIEEIAPQDLVIMDITIPGDISVEKRLEKLFQTSPKTKVILISGYTQKNFHIPEGQAIAYLTKPFSVQQILQKIDEVLTENSSSA